MPHGKATLFRDEIHGDMSFSALLVEAINHPYFQRLRHIKQLGLAEYVFPCATHTRFQHSLGASFLAQKYFDSLLENYSSVPEPSESVKKVAEDETSKTFWKNAVGLAALLHDIGHGPLSHTFEFLDFKFSLENDISQLPASFQNYFKTLNRPIFHEEVSLLYLSKIIEAIDIPQKELYYLAVGSLIHKNVEVELAEQLDKHKILGGVEFHQLLRPLISGPFDVDRMDYIQRDSRNCGVHIGGIEWQRIVTKVMPMIDEKGEVALVSSVKNRHILDDFIFSLFQMYAQVYLHPKIVGIEELIKRELKANKQVQQWEINFDTHQQLTDENFTHKMIYEFGASLVEELLNRKAHFDLVSNPNETQIPKLKDEGFKNIAIQDRPMMKDYLKVYLWNSWVDKSQKEIVHLNNWLEVSPLASQFTEVQYSPNIWLRKQS